MRAAALRYSFGSGATAAFGEALRALPRNAVQREETDLNDGPSRPAGHQHPSAAGFYLVTSLREIAAYLSARFPVV